MQVYPCGGNTEMEKNRTETQSGSKKAYRPHPYSERLKAISMYEEGMGSKRIAAALGVDDSMVRSWLRKYRTHGLDALRPYARRNPKPVEGKQHVRRRENEDQFKDAYLVFSSTLEPVASITRRFNLDYHSFKYYVERYHPELVTQRESLRVQY